MIEPHPDEMTQLVTGTGRDADRTYRVREVDPVTGATYVLRLVAALRADGIDNLMELLRPVDADEARDAASDPRTAILLRTLAGCDPEAVRALMAEALEHVEVAADPKHPGMFRKVLLADIREKGTLADILGAFATVNITPAG